MKMPAAPKMVAAARTMRVGTRRRMRRKVRTGMMRTQGVRLKTVPSEPSSGADSGVEVRGVVRPTARKMRRATVMAGTVVTVR